MSITLFFSGLGLGMVFGWITVALLINFRRIWQGAVDPGSQGRQELAKALAQTPQSPW